MTGQQLADLGPALAGYLEQFLGCCPYAPTAAHLHTYVHGLLSDLERKTAEPIALKAGTPVRTLQEFLRDHVWDQADALARLVTHVAGRLREIDDPCGLGTVGIIDETSAAKQGTKTPGVQRQYLGCLGKVANGIVTVHLGVAKGRYKTLIGADLFLPLSWSEDRPRCQEADIPDDLSHRPKWEIALAQLDRAAVGGVALDWLTFDEEYGKCPGFLRGLDERGLRFVGEAPRTLSCLPATAAGQPLASTKGRQAEEVVRSARVFRDQRWRVVRLARQTREDQIWRMKAARVWHRRGRRLVGGAVLADPGEQRRDGGGEVLPLERAGGRLPGDAPARGVHEVERGARVPGGEDGAGLHALRGAELRGVDEALEPVSGGDGIRGLGGRADAGGKIRR